MPRKCKQCKWSTRWIRTCWIFVHWKCWPTYRNKHFLGSRNASTKWYHKFQNWHRSRCHGPPLGRTNKTEHSFNKLKQTCKKLTGPGNNNLKCIGYTYTTFQWGDKHSTELIYICQNLTKALLGKPAINQLQVSKLNKPLTYSCNEISTIQLPHEHTSNHKQPEENKFIQDYPEVFNGLGDIEGPPINIKLKPNRTSHSNTLIWSSERGDKADEEARSH